MAVRKREEEILRALAALGPDAEQLVGELSVDQRRTIGPLTVALTGHDLSVCHYVVPSES